MFRRISKSRIIFIIIAFFTPINIMISCSSDSSEDKKDIYCEASCSSMSWGIEGESGMRTMNSTCTRQYVGYDYIETCTGTVTYQNSGKTYNYEAVYNWPDCSITVDVKGEGKCTDRVNSSKKSSDCNCTDLKPEDLIINEHDQPL